MRKNTLFIVLALLFVACSSNHNSSENILTVTIQPQKYFLEQIAGDRFIINTLVPAGSSPETYEPSPKTMIELGDSKAYFKVGFLGYENAWSGKLAENNPDVKIVDCSAGIELLHDTHGHNHGHGHEHDGHHVTADPHVWSSARNAVQFSKNMLDALIEIDPDNASEYQDNYNAFIKKVHDIDAEISNMLESIESRSFIIYHPALSYFAHDYNLTQHSIEFEGKSPSPVQLKELIDLAKKENIKTVFIQQEFDVKNTRVIANEVGAVTHVINPLAYEWDKELINIATVLSQQ